MVRPLDRRYDTIVISLAESLSASEGLEIAFQGTFSRQKTMLNYLNATTYWA